MRSFFRMWSERLQHSWVFNALALPVIISLLCGLLVHWLTQK